MSKVPYIPKDYNSVTPYLIITGAAPAMEYYTKVFGASESVRINGPDGTFGHAELKICSSDIMLAVENPSMGQGYSFFFLNDPAPPKIYPFPPHAALPI